MKLLRPTHHRPHHVRDVSCREDQAHTHVGKAPQLLAADRNTAQMRLRRMGLKIVERFEHFAEHRSRCCRPAAENQMILDYQALGWRAWHHLSPW